MASENILMYCVKHKGGDRQTLHEHIRQHSVKAAEQVKLYGRANDLLERIRTDEAFALSEEELEKLLDPSAFTGMAERQCEDFLRDEVDPVLRENTSDLGVRAEVRV